MDGAEDLLGAVLEIAVHVGSAVADVGLPFGGGGEGAAASAPSSAGFARRSPERLEALALAWERPEAERVAATRALATQPRARMQRALMLLLADPSPALRAAAIEGLGKARVREAYGRIAGLVGETAEETAAIAGAIARLGGAAAEPRLLGIVGSGPFAAQLAAVRALGHVGTLRAVPTLQPWADAWFAGELGAAARHAVRLIQQRHSKAGRGSLSLGDARGGELSAAAPEGAVTEVPP